MTALSSPNNSECSSAEIKIINFSRVKIDDNDKEELESFLEDGVSPQLLNGEILWEEMCGSSYEALAVYHPEIIQLLLVQQNIHPMFYGHHSKVYATARLYSCCSYSSVKSNNVLAI